ncbi:MAG: hypothetical protein GY888_24620, partial [Planctomycetaceae bacterium]|nr:hypothetical protein [Planctomycetaceae bacterium]
WRATTGDGSPDYLSFGPYEADMPAGPTTVGFSLSIADTSGSDDLIATLDVYDQTTDTMLILEELYRSDFSSDSTSQEFELTYDQDAGHTMEFRVYWHGTSTLTHHSTLLAQGYAPFVDDRLASFPAIWGESDTWYMAYEAAGTSTDWPGDIGLATSGDGLAFTRVHPNPVLTHLPGTWEDTNIGTPSLWNEEGIWYLFFHGFDGSDVQVGLATGTDLQALTRHPDNPIVTTSESGWDSGTVGKRSIIKEGDWYYMAFEGSTAPPFDSAQ